MNITSLSKDPKYKFLYAAYMAALCSSGIGRNSFRLGSVLVYKNKIIKCKHNIGKTHPKLCKFTEFPFIHSESACILSNGLDNCENCIIYTVRILSNNEIALAKPCTTCYKLMQYTNIKKCYFTTKEGYNYIIL